MAPKTEPTVSNAVGAYATPFNPQFGLTLNALKPSTWLGQLFTSSQLWEKPLTHPTAKSIYPAAQSTTNQQIINEEDSIVDLPRHQLWENRHETPQAFISSLTVLDEMDKSLTAYENDLLARSKMTYWFQFGIKKHLDDEMKRVQETRLQLQQHGLLVVASAANFVNRSVNTLSDDLANRIVEKAKDNFLTFNKNNENKDTPLCNFFNKNNNRAEILTAKATNTLIGLPLKLQTFIADNIKAVKKSAQSAQGNSGELTQWGSEDIGTAAVVEENEHEIGSRYSLENEEKIFNNFIDGIRSVRAMDSPLTFEEEKSFNIATWKNELVAILQAEPGVKGTVNKRICKFCLAELDIIKETMKHVEEKQKQEPYKRIHIAVTEFKHTYPCDNASRITAYNKMLIQSAKNATSEELSKICAGFIIHKNILSQALEDTNVNSVDLTPVWQALFSTASAAVGDQGNLAALREKFRILNNFSQLLLGKNLSDACKKIINLIESQVAGEGLFDQICYKIREGILKSIGSAANVFYDINESLEKTWKALDCFSEVKNNLKTVCEEIAAILNSGSKIVMVQLKEKLTSLSTLLRLDELQKYLGEGFDVVKNNLLAKFTLISNYANQIVKSSQNLLKEMIKELKELFAEGKEIFKDLKEMSKEEWDYWVNGTDTPPMPAPGSEEVVGDPKLEESQSIDSPPVASSPSSSYLFNQIRRLANADTSEHAANSASVNADPPKRQASPEPSFGRQFLALFGFNS